MGSKTRLCKDTDYEASFWCAGGEGLLREEVWVNAKDEVVRYNLAFMLPHLFRADNGRVLGYDNAHGVHERHFKGRAEPVDFKSFASTAKRFYKEAEAIRRSYENESIH